MQKYICYDCGEVFDEDEAGTMYDDPSPAGVGLPSGSIAYMVCPHCGSDYYGEAKECPLCGEYHEGSELFCEDCRHKIAEEWKALLEKLVPESDGCDWEALRADIATYIAEELP